MRLIDGDALKEAISNSPLIDFTDDDIFELIDSIERPQGEWIVKEEHNDYPYIKVCECSECGKMICISHHDLPNFCDTCGADMRGEE